MEVNPLSCTDENDHEYKIKYKGYKEERLKAKKNKESGKKAPDITEFSFVHALTREELDRLIQLVCFSDMLSNEDKQQFTENIKLIQQAINNLC